MQELNTGIDHVRELLDPEKGSIDVSLIYAVANIYFPRLLRGYMDRQLPNQAAFQFRQGNTPSVINDVKEGLSEIGFCSYISNQPELRFHHLVRCPLSLLLPPKHPLSNHTSVSLQEISQYPLILSVDKTHYLESLLAGQGLEPIIMCRMGEDYSIANLVACGFGLSILPHNPQLMVTGAVLKPISDSCAYRDFYMVTSRTRILSPRAKDFRNYILSVVQSGVLDRPAIF